MGPTSSREEKCRTKVIFMLTQLTSCFMFCRCVTSLVLRLHQLRLPQASLLCHCSHGPAVSLCHEHSARSIRPRLTQTKKFHLIVGSHGLSLVVLTMLGGSS